MARPPAPSVATPEMAARLQPVPAIGRILSLARLHLDMDMVVLAAFTETGEMVGVVDADGQAALRPEAELPVEARRCRLLLEGSVPAIVPDVSRQRPPTAPGPGVGAYAAAPVPLPDGSTFGLLCAMARRPRPDLTDSARRRIEALADLAGRAVAGEEEPLQKRIDTVEETLGAIRGGLRMLFQPVFRLRTGEPVGFEALARFPTDPRRPPKSWFWRARQAGLAVDLEVAALMTAMEALPAIPEPLHLSVNIFSDTLLSADLGDVFAEVPPGRVVLELAEHERLADSRPLEDRVGALRRVGARFAVDDAGSGFSSMRHVLRIRPEILKLDMNLTHEVDHNTLHSVLVSSLASFAAEAGMVPAAEGIESRPQLEALRRLGVAYGQGHYLGRPHPEPTVPGTFAGMPWETVADGLP